MSDATKVGGWTLDHKAVSVGLGFSNHLEIVLDEDGGRVCDTGHYATHLVDGARLNGCPVRHDERTWLHPTFRDGQPFPHSQIGYLLRAAPDLLAALEEIVSSPTLWNTDSLAFDRCHTHALRAIAKARGES